MSLVAIATIAGSLCAFAAAVIGLLDYLHSKEVSVHRQRVDRKLINYRFREARKRKLRNFLDRVKNSKRSSSSERTISEMVKDLQESFPDEITGNSDALKTLDLLTKEYESTYKKYIYGRRRESLKKGIEDLRTKIKTGERSFETTSDSPHKPHTFNLSRKMILGALLGITLATAVVGPLILRLLLQPEPGAWFLTTLQQRVSEEPAEAFEVFLAMWLLLTSFSICALLLALIRRRLFHSGTQPNAPESPGGGPSVDSIPAPGGTDSDSEK